MSPSTLVSVEEYLTTDYSPDCDYVDGVLEDRNVGLRKHALTQKRILFFLAAFEARLRIFALQEQRIQVSSSRFRIPDICVMTGGDPDEEIFTTPPFLCIEVLSPDDRMGRMHSKIADFLGMGVNYVWVIDPYERKAWTHTTDGSFEAKDGVLRTKNPDIEMPLAEVLP